MTTRFTLTAMAALLIALAPIAAHAQRSFDTPDKAAEALVAAVKAGKKDEALAILGGGAEAQKALSSGDAAADADDKKAFIEAYDKKHHIETDETGAKATLDVGEDDWPFSIPLVKDAKGWHFDMAAGTQEILYRRVGRNELTTVDVLRAYVDAQDDYAKLEQSTEGSPAYAQKIVSSPGKKDGLYWPAAEGEAQSPLGELFADAASEGYKPGKSGQRQPFHGYFFKVLKKQGDDAKDGARDYVAHNRMIGGFAMIAWPAKYRNSGVQSFMVNQDGVVYESDLGPDTQRIASQTDTFNPGAGWSEVKKEQ
jgi:hypothetical protein